MRELLVKNIENYSYILIEMKLGRVKRVPLVVVYLSGKVDLSTAISLIAIDANSLNFVYGFHT